MASIPTLDKAKYVLNNLLIPDQIEKEWQKINKSLEKHQKNNQEILT
ncbi:MAG: hypothetical protein LBS33_05140 [Streptococcaceae bacterium]|jgi:hypothetical protein|nr:hypothetical protein [Streptococcaceae bacterium]